MFKILKFFDDRITRFGAPYLTFAIFGLINYPFAYYYRVYVQNLPESESFILRGIATLLSLALLLKDSWPTKLKKFLAIYWFAAVTISLPFLTTYLLLKNNVSLEWLVNFSVGLLITVLVLDWLMSMLAIFVGAMIGYAAFTLKYGSINFHVNSENLYLALYLYVMIILFCTIFARKKEEFNLAISDSLRKEVDDKTKELNKSLIMKENFLNKVNHEIRNPTNIIHVLTKDMLENYKKWNESKRSEALRQISENSKRLFDLVTNWIDISSLSTTKHLKFHVEQHNLFQVISESVKDIAVLARNKKIKVVFKKQQVTDLEEYNISFNKERIEQVIQNLGTNAIKFSPSNSTITVDIYKDVLKQENGKKMSGLCVSIADEGSGIKKEDLEGMFESFVRGCDAKSKPSDVGLGLGLSISREVIINHGGKIWVENNDGMHGCTFYFFIPFKIPLSVQERAIESTKSKASEAKKTKSKLNILVLDDEELSCKVCKLVLTGLGHDVRTFTGHDEFFKHLEDNHLTVDLVFVDLMMPVSGINIIREIKATELYRNLPIIIQSGMSNNEEVTMLLESYKRIGFVPKPYDGKILKSEIDRVVNDYATVE
jgi:signal transduction histidine kinase/CheY-like chemotaxis protein